MRWSILSAVSAALWSVAAAAQDLPPPPPPPVAPDFVAIVEPGKPMRLQAVAAAVPAPTAPAPATCTLPAIDRASTPSSACLTCHDGSSASDARHGHRFGIDYAGARARPSSDLRPDPQGVNNVLLQAGQVACVSCHAPTSTLPYHLAAPTGGALADRLCSACHVK